MRLFCIFNSIFLVFLISCTTITKTEDNRKKSAELKMEIGVSHLERNNLPLALKELLEAQDLDNTNPAIQNYLGLVYFIREKYESAGTHFSKAIKLSPQFTEAKKNLARNYIEQKNYAPAAKLLNEVLADLTYTNAYSANFNYGLLYFNQGKYELARPYFTKVLSENRQDCYALVYYARIQMETKNLDLAQKQLAEAQPVCVYQQIDEAHFYNAISMYRLGQKQKALALFQDVKRLFPEGRNFSKASQMIDFIQKENK